MYINIQDLRLKRKGRTLVSNPAGRWRIEGIYDIPRRFRKETKHENAQHSCLVNSQDGYMFALRTDRSILVLLEIFINYFSHAFNPAQPPSSRERTPDSNVGLAGACFT